MSEPININLMFLDTLLNPAAVILTVITMMSSPSSPSFDTEAAVQSIQQPDLSSQTYTTSETTVTAPLNRDSTYTVYVEPKPEPEPQTPLYAPPANVTPDPGSAQAEAWNQMQAYGWGQEEFNCLVALWNRESGWRVNAYNTSSGATGIPQALPGEKMASAGADWLTNPATQIRWGLNYIALRYQNSPCNAWAHSEETGWY